MNKKQKKQQENIQKKIREKKTNNQPQSPNQQVPGLNQQSPTNDSSKAKQPPQPNETNEVPRNKPIFPGGPTKNQVEEWKNKFKDIGGIYSIDLGDRTFIYRPINRLEYKEIINTEGQTTGFYREERIADKGTLWPKDYNKTDMTEGAAGIPTALSELIMRASAFEPTSAPQKL